jgi:hypothetical protein
VYGVNVIDDATRAMRAILTNQVAKFAPHLYVRLTHQTGRGAAPESAQEIASYFETCFADYFRILGVDFLRVSEYLRGKQVLEYGPGDVPGVALLMLAHGAERVFCIDRFSMVQLTSKNIDVLHRLIANMSEQARQAANDCFQRRGDPASGFREERLRYIVQSTGLSGLRNAADLVISRAVLEHVNDLSATFADTRDALRRDGVAVHQVDLKSHGLHRSNPLEFLTWPSSLWSLMYSGKGVPNRWRVNRYREELATHRLEASLIEPTTLADPRDIEAVRPYLAAPFRHLSDEDLSWLGFWLICRKARHNHP